MEIIGITGGAGSGKSRVAAYLEENYGAALCSLDDVARDLEKKGKECYYSILKEFGPGILGIDGEIDRKKLADIIFCDEKKRKLLNALVHPAVKRRVIEDIEKKRKEGRSLYVIEAALLPEAGYEDICPQTWYIYADEAVRGKRLKKSRGYSKEKIRGMMAAQSTQEVYRNFCSVLIDNSGDFEDTIRQIGEHL